MTEWTLLIKVSRTNGGNPFRCRVDRTCTFVCLVYSKTTDLESTKGRFWLCSNILGDTLKTFFPLTGMIPYSSFLGVKSGLNGTPIRINTPLLLRRLQRTSYFRSEKFYRILREMLDRGRLETSVESGKKLERECLVKVKELV